MSRCRPAPVVRVRGRLETRVESILTLPARRGYRAPAGVTKPGKKPRAAIMAVCPRVTLLSGRTVPPA